MYNLCVSSGYGRWRIAMFLNDKGIKTRNGANWHEASIGTILHNVMCKGILRSGTTYSEPFKELQIIDPYTFDLAQKLMTERVNEKKNERTAPLNTSGQSLLSGNVFCGHCGGRLVLTTNGKVVKLANGEKKVSNGYGIFAITRQDVAVSAMGKPAIQCMCLMTQ